MKGKFLRRSIVIVLLLSAVVAMTLQTDRGREQFAQLGTHLPEPWRARLALGPAPEADESLHGAGVIQAEEIHVASEIGGTITTLLVHEGESVRAGDVLVELDTAELDAHIAAAQAGVLLAETVLAQARAGARPGAIAVAEAQLAQAEAGVVAATKVLSATLALLENPQELQLQLAVTQAQLAAAAERVGEATANRDAIALAMAQLERLQAGGEGQRKVLVSSGTIDRIPDEISDEIDDLVDGVYHIRDFELHVENGSYELYKWVEVNIPLTLQLTPNQWWQAWVGVNAATAQEETLQASLAQLNAQLENPQVLAANVDAAVASLAQAEAQVMVAQANLDGYRSGALPEQISLLEEQVAQAQRALEALTAQRQLLTLTALVDGVVADRVLNPGEVAAPGATILTLARLQNLYVCVYVPEAQLGHVYVGQAVSVSVDSFPEQVFMGTVTRLADQAEFMPRNVTTADERALLVFAVEVRLSNRAGTLKPGMPADVEFAEVPE